MMRNGEGLRWIVIAAAACGGGSDERPEPRLDAGVEPPRGTVIRVAPDGTDAADGFTGPVATLGQAFRLATRERQRIDIELAAGTYPVGAPDILPYEVPDNVQTIAGPAGGGAIVVGKGGASPDGALMLLGGAVRDLELRGFAAAIEVRGEVQLTNLRVVDSSIAVLVSNLPGVGKIHIENLDVTSTTPERCTIAIQLEASTELTIAGLTTHDVTAAVFAPQAFPDSRATIDLTDAEITNSYAGVPCNAGLFELRGAVMTMRNSTVMGGGLGFNFYDGGELTIERSTIRGQGSALKGFGGIVRITDTVFTGNGSALTAQGGAWTLTGVTVTASRSQSTFDSRFSDEPLVVTMRGSTITDNQAHGVAVIGNVTADLGTTANPGNNVFRGNTGVGLIVLDADVLPQLRAAGNTWKPNLQASDADGKYIIPETLTGPIATVAGNNFALPAGASLLR